ncbi:hypothetical protein ACFQ7M_40385 [Streptomyces massasporeus]
MTTAQPLCALLLRTTFDRVRSVVAHRLVSTGIPVSTAGVGGVWSG